MTEKTLKISEPGHDSAGQQDDVEDYPEQSAAQSDYAPGLGLLARILCLGVVPAAYSLETLLDLMMPTIPKGRQQSTVTMMDNAR